MIPFLRWPGTFAGQLLLLCPDRAERAVQLPSTFPGVYCGLGSEPEIRTAGALRCTEITQ